VITLKSPVATDTPSRAFSSNDETVAACTVETGALLQGDTRNVGIAWCIHLLNPTTAASGYSRERHSTPNGKQSTAAGKSGLTKTYISLQIALPRS
jgi:hypothetical protein